MWDRIVEKQLDAFPSLIEHFDDMRYATLTESFVAEEWRNWSVGQVCRETIKSQIERRGRFPNQLDPSYGVLRPSYVEKFLRDREDAQKWWEKHQGKSLREIQIEVVEWVLAAEKRSTLSDYAADIDFFSRELKVLQTSDKPRPPVFTVFRVGQGRGWSSESVGSTKKARLSQEGEKLVPESSHNMPLPKVEIKDDIKVERERDGYHVTYSMTIVVRGVAKLQQSVTANLYPLKPGVYRNVGNLDTGAILSFALTNYDRGKVCVSGRWWVGDYTGRFRTIKELPSEERSQK